MPAVRRLAAILATDVAGYSRLMGADEEGTHERLQAHLREIVEPKIEEHRGRIVKNTGDGLLAEFASVIDALRCAIVVQAGMTERNAAIPRDKRIEFRIGIHQGDVVAEEHDIFGDAVNVAARLEGLAEPGGVCVSARVRGDAAGKLDLAFEDMGQQELKNIARPLRVYRVRAGRVSETMAASQPSLTLPDKPSIAVLPFQNMSGDPEQEYFTDGMVEEIITALSRIRWLFVIARNSSFTYKGRAIDVKQVGRELGVRYVLEGSVRKSGSRIRITAQLIETTAGAHLWADRFDGSLEDIFELQDEVASSVAGVIEPTLQVAEIRRLVDRPTGDMTAYDLYLRALSHASTWEKGDIVAALDLLGQAIERDPHYGPALALAALCHYNLHLNGWANDPDLSYREGVDLSRQALRVAGDDPGVLGAAAGALAYFGEDIHAAIELIDRALALNPSFARGWVTSGRLRLWAGQPELAISHFETSLRLSPHAHRSGTFMEIGLGHFFARRFEDAVVMLLRSLQEHPGWAPTYRFLAACYAHMGRLDEAKETIKRLKAVTPVVMPNAMHWRNPEHRKLFLDGLRLAAGEAA
jgi:TolB-like protein/class 3 adenylate cyclase